MNSDDFHLPSTPKPCATPEPIVAKGSVPRKTSVVAEDILQKSCEASLTQTAKLNESRKIKPTISQLFTQKISQIFRLGGKNNHSSDVQTAKGFEDVSPKK